MLYTLEKEMSLALIIEFFSSLPKLVSLMEKMVNIGEGMKQDSINKELEKYKKEVSEDLAKVLKAKTDEERKKLSLDLAIKLNR